MDGLLFFAPKLAGDHLSILSLNDLPLANAFLEVLVLHPELFPDEVLVRWTQEQDLILEATKGLRLRYLFPSHAGYADAAIEL